jgi:hypothetical protein
MLKPSVWSLLLVNGIPLFGVLFLDWSVGSILVLYWFENIVIGFYNVLKMAAAKGSFGAQKKTIITKTGRTASKIGTILFFMVHFGMFTMGHGIFVFSLFAQDFRLSDGLILAALALFVSHGVSFRTNFINTGEYKRLSFHHLFFQPYKRIVIMHMTIIFGAAAMTILKLPAAALVILVSLKTVIDVFALKKEQKKISQDRIFHTGK